MVVPERSTAIPQITPQEALRAVQSDTLLLDVREPEELAAVRYGVDAQLDIPLSELPDRLDEVPRDRPIIVACQSGGRSTRAIQLLQDAGFTQLLNLDGGLGAWEAAGLPVERGE